ncbi:TolC family protein [Duganella aceris]|uniref:TolC family protein n=1 Tax=Duganella aceris TaxID=2703883 RepID=A0ABX0FF15_9BURK|nr:TolC family protein [Duganella aceris]NGZ83125.1 TolC family protein [Duganella aceris]
MFKYILPLCVAAWPAYGRAEIEPAAPLTLPAALALAAGANPELSAARHEVQAVDGAVLQAGLLPNPSLSVERVDTRRDTRETTLLLSQPLELGGKRAARLQAAERGRDSATAELALKRAQVRADVIAAYFAVLAAQEHLRLAREADELAQRAAAATARRVVAGKVSPVEETRARVAASSVQLEAMRAASTLTTARKRLAGLWGNAAPRFERAEGAMDVLPTASALGKLGMPGMPGAQGAQGAHGAQGTLGVQGALGAQGVAGMPGALADPANRAALRDRLSRSPAMALARSQLGRSQALAQVELSRRAPDLTLNVGSKRSEELGRTQAVFGVSVPLPFFDRNQGNVLESARRVDKARDELAATTLRLDAELSQACEEFDLARRQAQALRDDILPGAQSAYDAASTGFEYGKFGFLDVLDAQRTLLQAKSQYLNTLAEAHRAMAAIDRILGVEND